VKVGDFSSINQLFLHNSEFRTSASRYCANQAEVDWQSVNRILVENADFKDYIELVSTYYQTGRVRARDWNK
jgi:hypothetical protein